MSPNKITEKISSMAIVLAKPTSIKYKDYKINILDTPGHAEVGESYEQTVIRELKEETGVEVTLEQCLGQIDEFRFFFDGEKAVKVIKVFLFKFNDFPTIVYNREEGFIDGKWVDVKDGIDRLIHKDAKESLKKALLI